ncbi:MAG: hypothetical protein N3F63_01345 [Thermoplasmata archaeon]|nr:hypothetical protein [Thermoplasmata archaeon]
MRKQRAEGFAPGHISAFFAPFYHGNVFRTGSYGAGVAISSGCTSEVWVEDAEDIEVVTMADGEVRVLEVTAGAVRAVLEESNLKMRVVCNLKHALPVSQGFGMSASGTLSVLLALCKIFGMPASTAFRAAHRAEVLQRTGLGDVAGICAGGYEIRLKPGIPPYGIVDGIVSSDEETTLVLCVLGDALETKKVLGNRETLGRCSIAGRKALAKLLKEPTVKNLCRCGFEFAKETGLASMEIQECVNALWKAGIPASMVMLGNSVFAVAGGRRRKRAETILESYGRVYRTQVWHPL